MADNVLLSDLGLTDREHVMVNLAFALVDQSLMPDRLDDFHLTPDEHTAVMALTRALHAIERERQEALRRADRRARRLLRSYLSTEQRRQLSTGRAFRCIGSDGGVYRLSPRMAAVERIERHGCRWYAHTSFCLHDYAADSPDEQKLPAADVSLTHLLLLRADEPAFLAAANATDRRTELWNGDWLRRLRQARREMAL